MCKLHVWTGGASKSVPAKIFKAPDGTASWRQCRLVWACALFGGSGQKIRGCLIGALIRVSYYLGVYIRGPRLTVG